MAMIHLAREGASIGSFSREEIQEGLRTGRFLSTDLAWEEGMPDWRPLSEVVKGPTPSAPSPQSPTGTDALAAQPQSSAAAAETPGSGLPWEHRDQLGFFKAFIDTVSMVLVQPGVAFSRMKAEGDMLGPLLFGLIGGSVGGIVSMLFQLVLQALGFMADRSMAGMGFVGIWAIGWLFLVPIFVTVGIFIWSGILHVCLMMLGGAKKSFETTFRVVCFSSGSTYLLCMVPLCGGMIAFVWNVITECIGLSRGHGIDTGKAVMAVLLPMVVCCGGIMILAVFGGLGALSQLSR